MPEGRPDPETCMTRIPLLRRALAGGLMLAGLAGTPVSAEDGTTAEQTVMARIRFHVVRMITISAPDSPGATARCNWCQVSRA